jgi:glycosyltransferase involved in cell wall biosynthesis
MRITIDARMMGAERTRGIGRLVEEIVRAMLEVNPNHTYIILERHPDASPFLGHPSVEHVKADIPWYGLAEQIRMPGIVKRTNPDILLVPHWNVPTLLRIPRAVFIHDLILLDEPASSKATTRGPLVAWAKRFGYLVALQNALTRSRVILVPTACVRERIAAHFPSLETPVVVAGEGMPSVPMTEWTDPDHAHPYLLYVGSAYPHKNLEHLLIAWSVIEKRHPSLSLTIAGEHDVFMKRVKERAASLALPRISFPGAVTDERLRSLYAGATAFVYPSRSEGFGLPPLEALAHGIPVAVSDIPSLREVLGNEGILTFQGDDPDDIVRAVETVLQNPYGARGRARDIVPNLRERHDWRRAARVCLEALERAVRP